MSRLAISAGALVLGIGISIAALHYSFTYDIKDAAATTGILVTGVGLWFGGYSLRENHRWNRYDLTITLMSEWNDQVREHLDVLDSEFTDLRQIPKNKEGWGISTERAKKIAHSTKETSEDDFALRNSLITTLNYFELLARAYELPAVDEQTVKESFGPIILMVWEYFAEFVDQMRNDVDREPWPPVKRDM